MTERIERTRITADASQFNAEMEAAADKYLSESQRISSAMREAMQSVTQHTNNAASQSKNDASLIGKAWTEVHGKIMAAVAGAVSLAAMNAAVAKTVEYADESKKLAGALGLSRTEASELAIAISSAYATSDQVIAANRAITKSLVDNEGAFRNLGVATRDTNGGFRNSLDIMLEVNQKLLQFREGTDRNIEGQKIYKKAWEEVRPVLRVTTDLMEESRERAAALGLALGKEDVDAIERYKAAQNDAKDVSLALSKAVSDAVMPVLTDFYNEMAETGPDKVEMLRKAMAVLVSAFYGVKFAVEAAYYGLRTALESAWEVVKAFVQTSVVAVLKFADTADRALHLDFAGAKAAWKAGADQQLDIWSNASARIAQIAETNRDKLIKSMEQARAGMARALEGGFNPAQGTRTVRTGGAGSAGGEDKASMQKWEGKLAAERDAFERQKLLEGSFQIFSKQQERDFWQAKIQLTQKGTQTRAEVEKRYYAADREVRKQAFEAQIAQIHAEVETFRAGTAQRVSLANKAAVEIGARYGYESKEYLDAVTKANGYAREFADKQRELAATRLATEQEYQASRVELERANVETLYQLGQLTNAQRLEALKNLKEIEYQINLKGLESQAELYANDEVEYAKHLQRLAALKQKHGLDMKQIDGQIKVESFKTWRQIGDAITGAFSTAIKGVIMGTQSLSQAFRNMGQTILLAMADIGAKLIATELVNKAIKLAITKETATQEIAANAGVAASGAAASVAGIPIVGWAMAAGVAAAVFAMVNGYSRYSAAGGFDIPAGVNPLVQAHSEEMVLPAYLARSVRDMAAGNSSGGTAQYNDISVVQHFHLGMPTDRRTQSQLAAAAASGMSRAMQRNG